MSAREGRDGVDLGRSRRVRVENDLRRSRYEAQAVTVNVRVH